jgi:hypothetical protein
MDKSEIAVGSELDVLVNWYNATKAIRYPMLTSSDKRHVLDLPKAGKAAKDRVWERIEALRKEGISEIKE